MALTDFLTQIANSIRSKDGTTDLIVATDFPQRILDIPSGGGDINLSYGTFIPTENTKTVIVEHGLNIVPNFGIVFIIDDMKGVSNSGFNTMVADFPLSNMYKHYELRIIWGNMQLANNSIEQQFVYDDTAIAFNILDVPFWVGKNYMWICGRIEVNA